jgi:hypothetical protein
MGACRYRRHWAFGGQALLKASDSRQGLDAEVKVGPSSARMEYV